MKFLLTYLTIACCYAMVVFFKKGAIEDIFQSDVISRFLGKNVDVARKEDGYYALTFLE